MLLREMSSLGFAGFAETAFERQAQSLGLTPAQWKDSPALRAWAQRHCDVHFVPEKLLSAWGLTPNVIISDEHSSRRQAESQS